MLRELKAHSVTGAIPVFLVALSEGARHGLVLGAATFLDALTGDTALAQALPPPGEADDPHTILLVSEDLAPWTLLRHHIEQAGWTVDTVAGGLAALGSLTQQQYALVAVDLMLSGTGAIDLIAAIRARPGGEALPILAVVPDGQASEAAAEARLTSSIIQAVQGAAMQRDGLVRSARALVQWYRMSGHRE